VKRIIDDYREKVWANLNRTDRLPNLGLLQAYKIKGMRKSKDNYEVSTSLSLIREGQKKEKCWKKL
jgi:hypothetical protein